MYKGRGKKSRRGKSGKGNGKGKKKESRFKERTFDKTSADYILEQMEKSESKEKVHELRVFESDEEETLKQPESNLMEIVEEEGSGDEGQETGANGEDTDAKKPQKKRRKKKMRKGDLKRKKRQEEERLAMEQEASKQEEETIGNYNQEDKEETEEFKIKKIEKKLDRSAPNGGITAKSLNVIVDKEIVIIEKKDIQRLREIRAERERAEFEKKLEEDKMAKIKESNASELEKLQKKLEEKRLRQQKKKGKKKGKKKRR